MCLNINLTRCATTTSSLIVEATSLDVQEPEQEDEVEFSSTIDTYRKHRWVYSTGQLGIVSQWRITWMVKLSSDITRYQRPHEKKLVPTYRLSLKVSTDPVNAPPGNLHRSHFRTARSLKWETQKLPSKRTLCSHLFVAWWFSSPRLLGVATDGPRLLKTTAWILGSASRAAHLNKIWRRVHW
jgi:hypothetical protein